MLEVFLPLVLLICLCIFLRNLAQRPSTSYHRLTHTANKGWTIERRGIGFTIYTLGLNDLPRSILAWLGPRGAQRLRDGYDIGGGILGVGGMVLGTGGAVWAWARVWLDVWEEAKAHAEIVVVVKRAMDGVTRSFNTHAIQPLIPGISMPLTHLPTLVLVVILNQLFHELGHALAAAIEGVDPSRLSFETNYFVPTATVSFPSTIDFLTPRAKIRLATSGPFHNLITAGMLYGLAFSGAGLVFWRDQTEIGRVIYAVDPMSPLYGMVEVGETITHLDGVSLGGEKDVWADYLSGTQVGDAGKGWCLDSAIYDNLVVSPCAESSFETTTIPSSSQSETRCLPVSLVGQQAMSTCPCSVSTEICVRPSPESQVLRIGLESAPGIRETLFWQGDRAAILGSVQFQRRGPRWPRSLVLWGDMFLNYMTTVALSLFLLNLLPLPYTDGAQLLTSLLDLVPLSPSTQNSSRPITGARPLRATVNGHGHGHVPTISLYREYELNSDDEDIAEEGRRRAGAVRRGGGEEVWRRRIRRTVEIIVLGFCIGWAFGWAFLALLRSS